MTYELDLSSIIAPRNKLTRPSQILLVGESGNGKTHNAMTIAQVEGYKNVLVLDTEGSTTGVIDNFPDLNIDVVSIPSYAHLEQIVQNLVTKTHKYDVVILDTLTRAWQRTFNEIVRTNGGDTRAAYGDLKKWIIGDEGIMFRLKDAPFLSIVIAHSKEDKDANGAVIQRLNIDGGAKSEIASIPDVVLYQKRLLVKNDETGEQKVETILQTRGDNYFTLAKTRFNRMPDFIREADMPKVFSYIDAPKDNNNAQNKENNK